VLKIKRKLGKDDRPLNSCAISGSKNNFRDKDGNVFSLENVLFKN